MPFSQAVRYKLPRRIVLLCMRHAGGKIFLIRRPLSAPQNPGLWDISASGPVYAGESRMDAALRELHTSLGITNARMREVAQLPYTDSLGARLSASFFLAGPVDMHPVLGPDVMDGMYVDADEIHGLARYNQDLLTPELIWAIHSGWIFGR